MKINTYNKVIYMVGLWCVCISVVFAQDGPWRIHDAMNMPGWLTLTGQHRIRFENLDGQFRGGRDGGDQVLLFRTNILAEIKANFVRFGAEFIDSRSELGDSDSAISASVVNPLELLQAYVDIPLNDMFVDGSVSTLRGGRLTMDLGSRRLLARNRFRNTINNFTGVDWQWTSPDKNQFRAFYTSPVVRRIDGNILDNDPRLDKEFNDVKFWGVYYSTSVLPWRDKGEIYLLGLNEDDAQGLSTRNRDLYTISYRIYRGPKANAFDYQIESAFQFGESRRSTASVIDLDHFAHFHHAEIGYSFNSAWSPRLQFQYDYASGDDNPADGDNKQFDTLFGARRFDFGPTSIYGPFARSNISSPGLRLELKPADNMDSFIALRGYWLASADDVWTTSGIANPPGIDDSFLGTQIEVRLRWEPVQKNIKLDAGIAHLFAGNVMDNASKGDATYVYTSIEFLF